MKGKINLFHEYLNKQKEECLSQAKSCMEDDRKDEGIFLKAKANIFEVFDTMLRVSEKSAKSEEELEAAFIKKTETIPSSWKVSYEKAKEFNDIDKMMMEETKLLAVKELVEEFYRIWRK